jgi:hypothetical protein
MFSEEVIRAVAAAAGEVGVDPAALLAVAEVESGGKAFALVEGRREPVIRFEAHYFDRRLAGEKRDLARRAGLASPKFGGVVNPRSQAARWRMLERAAAIDRKAACESTSWGLGQIMGAHWVWLGYPGIEALVGEARDGAAGQAKLMARYIEKAGLAEALRERDWEKFARGYNGPKYRRNAYHLKIRAAYERHRERAITGRPAASQMLQPGARGEAARELQVSLTALGYPVRADGVYGPATAAAVRRFQKDNGLAADGIAGPQTAERIADALKEPRGGKIWARLKRVLAGWLS